MRKGMESLESRRLLAVNLHAHPDTTFVPNVVLPGATFSLPVEVENHGDTGTASAFTVAARLVPISIPEWFNNTATFGAASAYNIGSTTVNGLAAGEQKTANINVTIPSDRPSELCALVVKADSNSQVVESDENDNEDIGLSVAVIRFNQMALKASNVSETILVATASVDGKKAVSFKSDLGALTFRVGAVAGINLSMLGGDDTVIVDGVFDGIFIDGGEGNDRIAGNEGHETLAGGAGKDVVDGGGGNDRLNGNGGNDKLFGSAGADRLYGYDGNDYLDGGSSGDRFEGGNGLDSYFGQGGNDKFFAADNFFTNTQVEQIFGGSGEDSAAVDAEDIVSSVESVVVID